MAPVQENLPKPALGPGSLPSFVGGLSTTDAVFEVVVGQGRILTIKEDLAVRGKGTAVIALGNPRIADFQVIGPRQIRLTGQIIGVTDLSIITADERTYTFEVRVVADLDVLRAQLRCLFPDTALTLGQVRDHIVVEGQARDNAQVARILEVIRAYLASIYNSQIGTEKRDCLAALAGPVPGRFLPPIKPEGPAKPDAAGPIPELKMPFPGMLCPEVTPSLCLTATVTPPQIINMIRVPTSQQVLLKVRVAELNRTALRKIGTDIQVFSSQSNSIFGTAVGNASVSAAGQLAGNQAFRSALTAVAPGTTSVFGIFPQSNFEIFFNALRRNQILKILAEPNLVALNGQRAHFLAGGQYFIPVAQTATGGGAGAISAAPVDFGVRLDFLANILDDEVIRLTVDPEVSQPDFAVATTLVTGGSPVPGLSKRRVHTTVELHQGQTLAIAGLLSLTLDGTTSRIPGLGDLPILGPFFSNTTGTRTEKELVILVTPYLVEPMNHDQVPPTPGDEVKTPTDFEFYLLNRIEGRRGEDFRATTDYDICGARRCLHRLHQERMEGPCGHCE